jgi:hypothetical protein
VRRAIVAGAALLTSLGIEFLQVFVVAGRDANLRDLLANGLGGFVGIGLADRWRQLVYPEARLARVLTAVATGVWIGSRLATVLLLEASAPEGRWFGQIAPQRVYPADFRGEVLAATISGLPLRSGLIGDRTPFRSALLADADVRVVAVGAEPTAALASIASVLDSRRRELFVIGQLGHGAKWRMRLRAADLGLRVPSIRVPSAFGRGDTTRLEGARRAGHLQLSAQRGENVRSASVRLDAGLLWALLLPGDALPQETWPWLTALWTAVWIVVIARWSARGGLRRRWLLLILAVGLLLPVGSGGPLPGALEWFGALTAAVLVAHATERRITIARPA